MVTTTVPGGASSATAVTFNSEINIGILSFWSPTVIWTKQDPDLKCDFQSLVTEYRTINWNPPPYK
jgi:hypothetical protein